MQNIAPIEAVQLILQMHRGTAPLRARMALCGAIRAGLIGWRPQRWTETFTAENGATFDAAGGWTAEEPTFGWPDDFWTAGIASDRPAWEANIFWSSGVLSVGSAPAQVARWLGKNGGGLARFERYAEDVIFNRADIERNLGEKGWSTFANVPDQPAPARPSAKHYRAVLVQMVAEAAVDGPRLAERLPERLREAFAHFDRVPDEADIQRLAREIRGALQLISAEEPAPPN